jgi:hypothetical protein
MSGADEDRGMDIVNTTKRMKDPVYRALMFDGTANPGGHPGMIEQQEKDGQRQLVNSDRLPTDYKGDRAEWEALGFTFGDPDPDDPLFMPATLPSGWKREGSDHAMWSHLIDGLGRQRAAIFYKAAHYDRSAFMRLVTVRGYVDAAIAGRAKLLCDGSWATRDAVTEALRAARGYAGEQAAFWRERPRESSEQYVGEHEANILKCDELLGGLG